MSYFWATATDLIGEHLFFMVCNQRVGWPQGKPGAHAVARPLFYGITKLELADCQPYRGRIALKSCHF
jgi:hypothetical protein